MRLLLLVFSLMIFSSSVFSQLTQPCTGGEPVAYDDCQAACAVCDISVLNGISFNSGSWTPDHVDQLSYNCNDIDVVMNNNGWVGFVANSTTLELQVTYSNCTGGNSGVGMQALIVESSDCQNFVLKACKGDASPEPDDTYNLVANGLVVGQSYYLVLDGYAGSVCDVSVEVIQGGGTPQVGSPSQFTGPTSICPGETVTYTYGPVDNASVSSWVLPEGATLANGDDPTTIALNANTPTSVEISFGNSEMTGSICVTPYNGCTTGPEDCIDVTVASIPDTQLPSDTICYGETYTAIDGNSYTNNNSGSNSQIVSHQVYEGGGVSGYCDSLVLIDMVYLPNMSINAPTIYACQGDTVMVGDEMILANQFVTTTATSQNGCDSTVNVQVTFVENYASANGPFSINCIADGELVGSGSTNNGSYAWYDPSGTEISTTLTATADVDGQYFFVVTNIDNGLVCTDTAFADVVADFAPPANLTASAAGAIGCGANASTTLTGDSDTPNATYNWLDPSGTSIGSTASVTVSQTGTYQFIATNPVSGCKDTIDVLVVADASVPDISATGGIIDCDHPDVTISATSMTSGLDYNWSGPGGFTSTNASELVSTPGSYLVTVTDATNGCINSTSVIVADSTTAPSLATAGSIVGCNASGTTITVTSNTGTIFSWTGPGGYTSSVQNPNDITVPGDYNVTVTNPNGCVNTGVAVVASDTISPVVNPTSGTISCTDPNITISANSNPSSGVTYSWSGPNGTEIVPSFLTTMPGSYSVTVTNTTNGCVGIGSTTAIADTTSPTLVVTADATLIDCNNLDVLLTATTDGLSYYWSGNGLGGTTSTATVTGAGIYSVQVTGANGCTQMGSIEITSDKNPPDVSADDVDITCTDLTPTVAAISSVSPVTYLWSGPNSFSATTGTATVSEAGQYTVTITDSSNGCTNTTNLTVNNLVTVPDIITTNDSLGCGASATAELTASAVAGSTYSWTGPGAFVGTGSIVTVNATGTYTVEVTDPGGCVNTATAEVYPDVDLPQLSTTMNGDLDCSYAAVDFNATSTTYGVTYEWTGPGGSTIGATVAVSTFDEYTVVATAPNGCINSATITATPDTISPTLTGLVASNDLNCAMNTALLSATTNATSFSWSGPNGFASTAENPSIVDGGLYMLTVTGQNHCISTDEITVAQDTITPDVSANDTLIGCLNTSAILTATSTVNISDYAWTGPSGFTGNTSSVTVTEDGIYTVEVTALNGCKNTTTASVASDFTPPNISAHGGTLTCLITSIDLEGNSATLDAVGEWTDENDVVVSNDIAYTATSIGSYTLTVTGVNGCVSDTTVIVDDNITPPDADASVLDVLTCTTTSVEVKGTSTANGASYSWTGPNAFTSATQDIMVTEPGLYTLTVLNPNTGCTNTDTVTVFLNAVLPQLTAVGGLLDCYNPSILITSSSMTSEVSYAWSGPGIGTSPSDQDQTVSIPGDYVIEVTAENGCKHDTTIVVTQDTIAPKNVIATGGVILCGTSDITLAGSSSSSIVSYSWVGPGNVIYDEQNPMVDEVGIYTLTVEDLMNGCVATDTANVAEDINAPKAAVSSTGSFTCTNSSVSIMGSSTTSSVTYLWTTPSGATFNTAGPHTVTEMGSYKLVVSAPNGCSTTKNIAPDIDTISPGAMTLGITLTCADPNGTLVGSTNSTNAVSYSWTGPNGYLNTNANATNVVDAGTYFLTVTDDVNGCTSETDVEVLSNQANPDAFANDAVIDCNTPTLNINAGSNSTVGVTFSWAGPGGFTSDEASPEVNVGGQYTLTVLDPTTGCTAMAVAQIKEDKVPPNVMIDPDDLLITCAVPNVTILGSSSTFGAIFSWAGPNGFSSSQSSPIVTDPGLYELTVTGPNGCTATAPKNVDKDSDFPVLATQVDDTLTCVVDEVDIHVNETTGKTMTYEWTGPGGFTSSVADATASMPGTYNVVGTASNGCQVTSQAVVILNDTQPTVLAGGAFEIDCVVLKGTLNADGSATGSNISYQWSTAQGHIVSGADSPNPLVDGPGTYELMLTDATNGCTNTSEVVVTADAAIPNDLRINLNQISCYGANDGVALIQEVIGGTEPFQFSFNGGPFSNKLTFTDLGPGDYPISVIDANGCRLNTGVSIVEPDLFAIDLGPDQSVVFGDKVSVKAFVDDTKRVSVVGWNNFLDSTCLFTNPMACYEQKFVALETTVFEVAATDTSGCDASDRMIVFVEKPQNVYFPNIFTPNGDAHNDLYEISTGQGVALIKSFVIFDRWGNLMTDIKDIQPGQNILIWNGEYRNSPVNPGVYVYRAEVYFLNGDKEIFIGDITLLR